VDDEKGSKFRLIPININTLIEGLYGATTAMVALSALAGKISPLQQLLVSIVVVVVYGFNYYIGTYLLHVMDLGGSMLIWTFGTYFGLAFSFAYFINTVDRNRDAEDNESRYESDIFALFGTIFLWVLWPSFNAALAEDHRQYRIIVNTVLALCASNIFAFTFSRVFRGGKFKMLDIQRATISGGIAMASVTSVITVPGGALVVGCIAAFFTEVGFVYITPWLGRTREQLLFFKAEWAIDDPLGIHNMYGIPGIFGAVAGIISAAIVVDDESIYGETVEEMFPHHKNNQAAAHLALLGITLFTGLLGGFILGLIFKVFPKVKYFYSDEEEWEVPKDFENHINPEALQDLADEEHKSRA
jgi:ammonium transporter Rh